MLRRSCHVLPLSLALAALAAAPAHAQELRETLMWLQSALVPYGPNAGAISTLSWIMFAAAAAIFLLVMALAAVAIWASPARRRWMAHRGFIIALGIGFPVVALSALLVYGLVLSRTLVAGPPPLQRVKVIGEQWWWRVHYVDAAGETRLVSANEIRIPAGQPVEFILTTEDVIHSFWVPSLAGKLDMIPGRTNSYRFAADRPGIYRGQCAEYCGGQHALMAFYVVAMAPEDFAAWQTRALAEAHEPTDPVRVEGRRLFLSNGCGACHTIRGTEAAGTLGPDLTHVGGRLSLAAGTFTLNVGTLAGWIASAQHLKPENGMPSFDHLAGEELRAIAAYLESLK
ncbi:MAG: cytochrome c oxidase subunit II [Xanthobacteraceae bacterium]